MRAEAPHRLAEVVDLDPETGEPIELELGGAWPIGLWRPPRFDLGVRRGPLPPLGWAALILVVLTVTIRAAMLLPQGPSQDPGGIFYSVAWLAQTLLAGLAPVALFMASPRAAARHPAIVLGLLTGLVGQALSAVWGELWALQILGTPEWPPPVDWNVVVGVVVEAASAFSAVLVAYGLWTADGAGARRRPGVRGGILLAGLLVVLVGPALRVFLLAPPGVDITPVLPSFVSGVVILVAGACQAWVVATRLIGRASPGVAWRSAGAATAIYVVAGVLEAVVVVLDVARVGVPEPAATIMYRALFLAGTGIAACMTLAFWQGLPGPREMAPGDEEPEQPPEDLPQGVPATS